MVAACRLYMCIRTAMTGRLSFPRRIRVILSVGGGCHNDMARRGDDRGGQQARIDFQALPDTAACTCAAVSRTADVFLSARDATQPLGFQCSQTWDRNPQMSLPERDGPAPIAARKKQSMLYG